MRKTSGIQKQSGGVKSTNKNYKEKKNRTGSSVPVNVSVQCAVIFCRAMAISLRSDTKTLPAPPNSPREDYSQVKFGHTVS